MLRYKNFQITRKDIKTTSFSVSFHYLSNTKHAVCSLQCCLTHTVYCHSFDSNADSLIFPEHLNGFKMFSGDVFMALKLGI